jgi:hypothetical protein
MFKPLASMKMDEPLRFSEVSAHQVFPSSRSRLYSALTPSAKSFEAFSAQ